MEKSVGCIVFNGDKVLLVKQKSGFCGFPKGHVEGDETEVETALRETFEETGISVHILEDRRYEISYLVNNVTPKTVVFYVAYTDSLNPIYQEEELLDAYFVDMKQVYDELSFDNLRQVWNNVLEDLYGKVDI